MWGEHTYVAAVVAVIAGTPRERQGWVSERRLGEKRNLARGHRRTIQNRWNHVTQTYVAFETILIHLRHLCYKLSKDRSDLTLF